MCIGTIQGIIANSKALLQYDDDGITEQDIIERNDSLCMTGAQSTPTPESQESTPKPETQASQTLEPQGLQTPGPLALQTNYKDIDARVVAH